MSAHLLPGTVFAGDFRIVRKLARGGMGQVFEDTLNMPDVTSCMVERARAEAWPAPESGCVSVMFPVGF